MPITASAPITPAVKMAIISSLEKRLFIIIASYPGMASIPLEQRVL